MSGDVIFETDTGGEEVIHEYAFAKEDVSLQDAQQFGRAYMDLLKGQTGNRSGSLQIKNKEVGQLIEEIGSKMIRLRQRLLVLEGLTTEELLQNTLGDEKGAFVAKVITRRNNNLGATELVFTDEDFLAILGLDSKSNIREIVAKVVHTESNLPVILVPQSIVDDEGTLLHEKSHILVEGAINNLISSSEIWGYSRVSFLGFRDEIIARMVSHEGSTLTSYDGVNPKYRATTEEGDPSFQQTEAAKKRSNDILSYIGFNLDQGIESQDLLLWAMAARSFEELEANLGYIKDRYCQPEKPNKQPKIDKVPKGWGKG